MATSTVRHVFVEDEILNVVYTLESDDEYSEISDFESDNQPSDGDESDSAVTDQPAPQHSRERYRPIAPLFQWDSGVFNPVVQNFDNSASGISVEVIPDQPTALDIFKFFLHKNDAGHNCRNQ
jgi:hypothetical protein